MLSASFALNAFSFIRAPFSLGSTALSLPTMSEADAGRRAVATAPSDSTSTMFETLPATDCST